MPSESRMDRCDRSFCMRCMHQKTDYACYAKTQLRKRLHTMHTRRQFGSGVGLRGRKCMHLGMHTDCIQSAYKHIKREEERILPSYFFLIACVPSSSTVRVFRHVRIPSNHPNRPSGFIARSKKTTCNAHLFLGIARFSRR